MRLYIIGIMIGALGLVAANQVRAETRCGLRSDKMLTVQRWNVEQAEGGKYHVDVFLDSIDPKPIKTVSGSIEFFTGREKILKLPLVFRYPIQLKSHFLLTFERRDLPVPILAGAPDVEALACVAAVTYADGSGEIVN